MPKALKCQVQGCTREVPTGKVYYKRYRVCLVHSTLPAMVLGGRTVRWCQQCGKFQGIEDFEGDRKSCRRTLDQHNARRRRQNAGEKAALAEPYPAPLPRKSQHAAKAAVGELFSADSSPYGSSCCEQHTLDGAPATSESDASQSGTQQASGGARPWAPAAPAHAAMPAPVRLLPCVEAPGSDALPSKKLWSMDLGPGGRVGKGAWPASQDASRWGSRDSTESSYYPDDGVEPGPGSLWAGVQGAASMNGDAARWGGLCPPKQPALAVHKQAPLPPRPAAPEPPPSMVLDQLLNDNELRDMLAWLPSEFLGGANGSEDLLPLELDDLSPTQLLPASGPSPMVDAAVSMDLGYGLEQRSAPPAPCAQPTSQAQQQRGAFAPAVAQPPSELASTPVQFPAYAAGTKPSAVAAPAPTPALAPRPAPASSPLLGAAPVMEQPFGMLAGPGEAAAAPPPPRSISLGLASAAAAPTASLLLQPCQSVNLSQTSAPRSPLDFQEHMVRLSVKLFNITPDQLPEQLKREIMGLVASDPVFVDSFVRPGCTHLTISALVDSSDRAALRARGAEGVAHQLLRRGGWQAAPAALGGGRGNSGGLGSFEEAAAVGEAWAADMLVQVDGQVAVVKQGRIVALVGAKPLAPRLLAVRPAAILAPPAAHADAGGGIGAGAGLGGALAEDDEAEQAEVEEEEVVVVGDEAEEELGADAPEAQQAGAEEGCVTLWGYSIAGSHDTVVCRQGGRVLDLEIVARGTVPAATLAARPPGAPLPEYIVVRPLGVRVGLLQFEVQRGGVLSDPICIVGLPSAAAVEEAQQAQQALAGTPHRRTFLRDLGWLLSEQGRRPQADEEQRGPEAAAAGAARQLAAAPAAAAAARAASLALSLRMVAQAQGWHELSRLLLRPEAPAPAPGTPPMFDRDAGMLLGSVASAEESNHSWACQATAGDAAAGEGATGPRSAGGELLAAPAVPAAAPATAPRPLEDGDASAVLQALLPSTGAKQEAEEEDGMELGPSCSNSADLEPTKAAPSLLLKPGGEAVAAPATGIGSEEISTDDLGKILAAQLTREEAARWTDQGPAALPPPQKVGGLAAWVSMQMAGLCEEPAAGPGRSALGAGLTVLAVAVAAGAAFIMRSSLGEV